MTDGDRREIAEIVNRLLDEHLTELRREIAQGFFEAANGMMEDLAKIVEGNTAEFVRELAEKQRKERERNANRRPVGFTP